MDDHGQDVETLGKLIAGIGTAMLTTAEPDGSLRSRPMATQDARHFDGTLWFFTRDESPKVDEVKKDAHVNLAYSDPVHQTYVSVSGRATVVRDEAKAKELWTPAMKAWFPKGLDAPDLALLKVEVEKAEYWDTPPSAVVHLVGFVKATLTGKPYHPGDHAKVDLK